MRQRIPLLAASAIVLSTAAPYADLGDQLFKLLPDDGAELDWFGGSVAISGVTAIVGAQAHQDNGFNSGSAYLFNTSTGQQIARLLADDGAESDVFGHSVGISGATAIVGAWGDQDNGFHSGSAYLFDTTTGQQIAKLLPEDGSIFSSFGDAVAISVPTAIVGAFADDENGSGAGSAYLFDVTTPIVLSAFVSTLRRNTSISRASDWPPVNFNSARYVVPSIVSDPSICRPACQYGRRF